ncbi:MAG TPA: hypothetical protein VLE72_02405 [Candidatus Saccharimonadales bacterium]|nr:hypothetical protein [Candidatus Saccharimonadales bacterium]
MTTAQRINLYRQLQQWSSEDQHWTASELRKEFSISRFRARCWITTLELRLHIRAGDWHDQKVIRDIKYMSNAYCLTARGRRYAARHTAYKPA